MAAPLSSVNVGNLPQSSQDIILKIRAEKEDASRSVKSLRQELREANLEAVSISRQFGENSKEAGKAAQKVALLRDEMQDFNQKVKALNPDRFQRFATATSGIISGFQAAQGAAVLFGAEGEDLQKTMVKLQAVMAFSQGIQGVLDTQKAFSGLGTTIKVKVVEAFTTLKGAIIATGIGALLVGLGLLVANFDSVKKAVMKLYSPWLELVVKYFGLLVDRVTDFLGITTKASRALDKMIEDNEKRLKENEAFLDRNLDKYNKHTQAKLQADIDYQQKKIAIDKKFAEDEDKASYNQALKEIEDQRNRAIIRANQSRQEETDERNEKQRKEAQAREDAKRAETDKITDFWDSVKKQDEEETKAYDIRVQKRKDDERKFAEELRATKDEEFTKTLESLTSVFDKERTVATNNHLAKKTTDEEFAKELEAIKIRELQTKLTATIDYGKDEAAINLEIATAKDEAGKLELKKEKEYRKALTEIATAASISLINSLMELNQANEKHTRDHQKRAFQRRKALSIAETIISTYSAAAKAYEAGASVGGPAALAVGALYAAVAVAAGLAKLAVISKTNFENSGSGGGSAPSTGGGDKGAQAAATGFSFVKSPQQGDKGIKVDTKPVKVFVVSKDISIRQNYDNEILSKAVVK